MRTVDRIFGWLLLATSLYLAVFLGRAYPRSAVALVFCTALCDILLAAMNLMRAERPHDATLAQVCVAGNMIFGILIGIIAWTTQSRLIPTLIAALCLVLWLFSLRTQRRSRPL